MVTGWRWRRLIGVLALATAAGGYAALPPQQAAASTPGMTLGHVPTATAPTSATIVMGHNAWKKGYQTKVVTISQGGTLNVANLDSVPHTVTAVAVNDDGTPLFDRYSAPGSTTSIPAASKLAPGRYDFYCKFHPSMRGTLIVEGESGGVTPSKVRFEQPLKTPKVLTGSHLRIPLERADVRILPHGPRTPMWTYGGSYPGPIIRRNAGHATKVTFVDKLPKRDGSFTVHLHGDHHAWTDDGQPDRFLIHHGQSRTYDYPLTDDGRAVTEATNFYHDHRMDRTGRNNWHGLQGTFIVHSKKERSLPLPSGRYDVPLMVSDRSFDAHNRLVDLPSRQRPPPEDATVGNRVLVDGRYAPYLKVAARHYRLRLINSSNFSSYDFALSDGRPFVQIGTGASLLPKPVVRQDILLGPSQRADVVVDFHGELHHNVVLESVPRTSGPPSGIGTRQASLMQFRVTRTARDHTRVPAHLERPPALKAPRKVTKTWRFGLGGDADTGTFWSINGKAYDPHRIDATVPLGAIRTWRLVNVSPITHFIHLHEEQWHTIRRDGKTPPKWERGLEDTWRLDPGESVVIAAKFTDYTGVFMIHCHMLDHEDDGMMAQWAVVKPGTKKLPPGFYRAGSPPTARSADHSSMHMGMPMAAPVRLHDAAPSGWSRGLTRAGEAALVEIAMLALLVAARRSRVFA